ncbi:MAG: phospholipase D-like domain-containing protein [bacterium]|nr:phospholipase D-like domain-containing protein [bacterium]
MRLKKKLLLILLCALWAGSGKAQEAQLLEAADFAPALIRQIHSAQSRVVLATYVFRLRPKGRTAELAHELAAARKRGVKVEVFLEETGKNDSLDRSNRQAAKWLKARGILVHFDRPERRSHAKVAVVDGEYCFVGSHNLTESALRYNHEMSLLVRSVDLARQIERGLERNYR